MYCRKCGAQNSDEAPTCTACGSSMHPVQTYQQERPYYPPDTVPNYLVWSILAAIFCCQIPGIVAIVYSAQVNGKLAAGDYKGALDASNTARSWAWASFGLSLAAIILYGALIIFGIVSDMK